MVAPIGDPPQKLARHHNALVTERERSGARNGVGEVVVPAGRWSMLSRPPRAVLRSSPQSCKARMIEQLDAVAIQERQRFVYRLGFGSALCSEQMPCAVDEPEIANPAHWRQLP